jgi:hypothetical protein
VTTDSFDPPGAAVGIQWADYNGSLLLFDVLSVEKDINTRFSPPPTDAVKVSIHVLDGPGEGDGIFETLVFPKVLKAQLAGKVGHRVLGRLGQGAAVSGQSAPWKLEEASHEDAALARAWIAKNDKPPF